MQDTADLTRLISDRVRAYPLLAFVNVSGVVANLGIVLAYGPSAGTAGKLAILLSIVAVALVATLPARSLFADIDALRKDVAAAGGEIGAYGRELASKPMPFFINLTVGFNALMAVVQIWALYSA